MLINKDIREKLNNLFYLLKLQGHFSNSSLDKKVKIEQILAYLEIIHSEIRHRSKKKKLVLIDSGAGNCYLSFLVYYYYSVIEPREIEMHCVDINKKLMDSKAELAKSMNFRNIFFHAMDIVEFSINQKVDMVYSLHACDNATDKTMHLGIRTKAKVILSVSCCQHSLEMRSRNLKAVTRHSSFRDKMISMVSDSLRAILLENEGYKVNIFDFVSSRYTDKNTMVRAVKGECRRSKNNHQEYNEICSEFRLRPYLEELIHNTNILENQHSQEYFHRV